MMPSTLPAPRPHASPTSRPQRGQAMVEYAILLLLTTTLIAGGIELAIMAFASNNAFEAARAGAAEWALQKRGDSSTAFLPANAPELPAGPPVPPSTPLDRMMAGTFPMPEVSASAPLLNQARLESDWLTEMVSVFGGSTSDYDFNSLHIGKEIQIDGERYRIRALDTSGSPHIITLDRELPAEITDGFTSGVPSGGIAVIPRLGDHATASLFTPPTCVASDDDGDGQLDDHDMGLPPAVTVEEQIYNFYLLNPKYLDITDCAGNSEAIDGFRSLLPPVNRAAWPLLDRVCFDATTGATLSCADFNAGDPNHRIVMKMPGRIVQGSETYADGVRIDSDMSVLSVLYHDYTPGDSGWRPCLLDSPAGCYTDSPVPALALGCTPLGSGSRYDATELTGCGELGNEEDTADVRVIVRHRSYLNGLLLNVSSRVVDTLFALADPFPSTVFTFWQLTVHPSAAEHLDVRDDSSIGTQGFLGTEVHRGGVLKGRKDFRGCYDTRGNEVLKCN